jgi:hypothetical protein
VGPEGTGTIDFRETLRTGDDRYGWLNRIQAVGKVIFNEDLSLDFEWYEVR